MNNLIESLKAYKKERQLLVIRLLGESELPLTDEFRNALGCEIGKRIPDTGLTVFIDYHLDWIETCLNGGKPSTGIKTVRDVDLMAAFEENNLCYLVMVEAKAAESGSGFTKKQMNEKAEKLGVIFGPNREKHASVMPYFCMTSFNKPKQLSTDAWPDWMTKPCKEGSDPDRYYWIPLNCHSE